MLKCVSAKCGASKSAVLSNDSKKSSASERAQLWHYRLGRVGMSAMQEMQKHRVVLGWEPGLWMRTLFVKRAFVRNSQPLLSFLLEVGRGSLLTLCIQI
jgi:hypothetical protein